MGCHFSILNSTLPAGRGQPQVVIYQVFARTGIRPILGMDPARPEQTEQQLLLRLEQLLLEQNQLLLQQQNQ